MTNSKQSIREGLHNLTTKTKKYILKTSFFGDFEYPNKISVVGDILGLVGLIILLFWLMSKLS